MHALLPENPSLPVLFLLVLLISGTLKLLTVVGGWGVWRTRLAERFRVYRRELAKGQLRSEALAAVGVVLTDAVLIGTFRYFTGPLMAPFSLSTALWSYAWMFVGFEVWFYVTHRLLHLPRFYRFHAQHHVAQVTEPLTALSFSVVERVVLMGGGLGLHFAAMHVFPGTQVGILAYMLTNYVLNAFGHGNTEWLPKRFVTSWVGRVFFTPTFHALHHARYQGHYGLYTVVLDRWLGTAFADYPQVHARARDGEGLTRIGERLAVAPPAPSLPSQPEAHQAV
ncbi:sterol desaturase family protein [Corallococcus exiguus]|uniref:sterol desaturase family protein n=1 Tax=Corallococcus TaxID=83461 RepID=UPI000EE67066|nr:MULTISPECIES: sterol desaturase family protein [Corallococcus]NPC71053.1 sterol desaturase family protein [Corallococcus exiguus]RKI05488.1 sterol desaturase family protein [Corallococcus sp. AB038B]